MTIPGAKPMELTLRPALAKDARDTIYAGVLKHSFKETMFSKEDIHYTITSKLRAAPEAILLFPPRFELTEEAATAQGSWIVCSPDPELMSAVFKEFHEGHDSEWKFFVRSPIQAWKSVASTEDPVMLYQGIVFNFEFTLHETLDWLAELIGGSEAGLTCNPWLNKAGAARGVIFQFDSKRSFAKALAKWRNVVVKGANFTMLPRTGQKFNTTSKTKTCTLCAQRWHNVRDCPEYAVMLELGEGYMAADAGIDPMQDMAIRRMATNRAANTGPTAKRQKTMGMSFVRKRHSTTPTKGHPHPGPWPSGIQGEQAIAVEPGTAF